ncbi:MAG: ribonuclease H-like domain-containing protein [Anaerolineales bacterium]
MNLIVFDLETQNLFEEVGGRDPAKLRVSCAVTWSSLRKAYTVYLEKDVPALIAELKSAGRVIGFNIKRFDYAVLKPYAPSEHLLSLPTLDLMEDLYHSLGFRLSLDSLARATLDEPKGASGIQAVEWYRSGEMDRLVEYCKKDVDITRRLYEFGCEQGFVQYFSRLGSKQKVKVNWKC